ncbi:MULTISPECIES: MFS transporter [Nocardia]|uniref:MFS transporter n=1 Tax=Nocardia TaxID=1817 RepID=UPI0002F62D63|nr:MULTISPECIES: MFS transporter [Nocardia]
MTDREVEPVRSEGAAGPEPGGGHPLRWRILALLGLGQLMLILDVTVVALALPHIGQDLGLGREALTWTVSAYTLTFGGLMLLGGRVTDLFGSKPVVLAGLSVFTVASLSAGLGDSALTLLGGRIGQGVGAALLSPAALSLVVTLFEGVERNRALGVWSALGGGGAAIGVLAGGLLTAGPGWPWVFYVNVPIGVVVAVALAVLLPASARPHPRPRLDVLGAVLVTASSATLIYALVGAGDRGWVDALTAVLVGVAALGYLGFVAWQRHNASPLMDIRLLVRRPVATGTFLILMATVLMITVFFLGTFYFQNHHGYNAAHTGLLFLPVALATMAGADLTGRALASIEASRLAVAGLLVAAVGLTIPAIWLGSVPVVVGVAVAGAGTGALFVVASATALGQVAPHEAGIASGIVSTFHEFGASLGAAVTSSVAAASLVGTTTTGYTRGFVVAAVVAALAAIPIMVLAVRGAADAV